MVWGKNDENTLCRDFHFFFDPWMHQFASFDGDRGRNSERGDLYRHPSDGE